jgi:hypothetical protein
LTTPIAAEKKKKKKKTIKRAVKVSIRVNLKKNFNEKKAKKDDFQKHKKESKRAQGTIEIFWKKNKLRNINVIITNGDDVAIACSSSFDSLI